MRKRSMEGEDDMGFKGTWGKKKSDREWCRGERKEGEPKVTGKDISQV